MYDAPPASEPVVPTYPCDDCPSSGSTCGHAGSRRDLTR